MNPRQLRMSRSGWLVVFAIWTVFGLFMTTQGYVARLQAGRPSPWLIIAAVEIPYCLLWGALTPVVLLLARRFPIEREHLRRGIGIHLVAGIVLGVVHASVTGALRLWVYEGQGWPFTFQGYVNFMLSYFDYGMLLYWIILLVIYAIDYTRRLQEKEIRASQLEAQLAQARFQALKMQLHPHFLFNTLNAISVLIGKNPDTARKTVGRLSDLLRQTLENDGAQEVTLRSEVDFLERYLQIEQTRFGDRLSVNLDVDPETYDAAVPTMVLQPLVENAIKHGITRRRGPARIDIRAHRSNGSLEMMVLDNGMGLKGTIREGVGLANTRARLRQLYGEQHDLTLANAEGGGVIATVTIPFSRIAHRESTS